MPFFFSIHANTQWLEHTNEGGRRKNAKTIFFHPPNPFPFGWRSSFYLYHLRQQFFFNFTFTHTHARTHNHSHAHFHRTKMALNRSIIFIKTKSSWLKHKYRRQACWFDICCCVTNNSYTWTTLHIIHASERERERKRERYTWRKNNVKISHDRTNKRNERTNTCWIHCYFAIIDNIVSYNDSP